MRTSLCVACGNSVNKSQAVEYIFKNDRHGKNLMPLKSLFYSDGSFLGHKNTNQPNDYGVGTILLDNSHSLVKLFSVPFIVHLSIFFHILIEQKFLRVLKVEFPSLKTVMVELHHLQLYQHNYCL